jgi:hypothetical protein
MTPVSGASPFAFRYRPDLGQLTGVALEHEDNLHTSFTHSASGEVYFGLPDVGIIRMSAGMDKMQVIPLPDPYNKMNLHSVRLAIINGNQRLILSANDHEAVLVSTLDGDLDFVLSRPSLPPYYDPDVPYKPTDALLVSDELFVADGYGANFVLIADINRRRWTHSFGGHTEDRHENGRFRTAHGLTLTPDAQQLIVVDRWNSRLQVHDFDGAFVASHVLPYNAWLCNLDVINWRGRWLGVIACLYNTDEAKTEPAPVFVVDMTTYEVLSTIQPKVDFGVERAQRMHNAVWHEHDGRLFIIGHSWQPGKLMIFEQVDD